MFTESRRLLGYRDKTPALYYAGPKRPCERCATLTGFRGTVTGAPHCAGCN